jgi:L-lactate utilization protein LutC
MFLGVTMAQAQESLEDLQKRKTIAEAEKAAIQAETARDEARKKQSELGAPLDPVKKAQSDAQSLCTQCIQAAQEEVKKCLDSAISQEDKKSCLEKQETRTKTCSNGECKIERAQGGSKGEVPSEKK